MCVQLNYYIKLSTLTIKKYNKGGNKTKGIKGYLELKNYCVGNRLPNEHLTLYDLG